jgi:GntR family transcriptional regulator, transcriptional repressor for pyruvate dehydrogenase complex
MFEAHMESLVQRGELTRIERSSIKELALDQLKRYIRSGGLKPGERLPSERDLAETLGVGRSSIREALKIFEAVGLVESRIGEGTFVTAQAGSSFGRTIGLSLAAMGGTVMEIMDARRMLEVEAVRSAAERANDDDLRVLGLEVQRMEVSIESNPLDYLTADMNFHRLIGRATHNGLVAHIITNLIDMLEESLRQMDRIPQYTFTERRATHREISEAIAKHDAKAAADAMGRHQQEAAELWKAVISLGTVSPDGEGQPVGLPATIPGQKAQAAKGVTSERLYQSQS